MFHRLVWAAVLSTALGPLGNVFAQSSQPQRLPSAKAAHLAAPAAVVPLPPLDPFLPQYAAVAQPQATTTYDVVQAGPPANTAATSRYDVVPAGGEIPHPLIVAAQPPLPPVPLAPVPENDVVERLRQAETRIRQLEQSRDLDINQDKQTSQVLETLRTRWDSVRDPSITTVDQQTYKASDTKASEKKWFDRLSIRGYTQMRLNEVLTREAGSAPPQYVGDRSIGDDQSFILRRVRLIISGDVSDRMYVYMQPDFAVTTPGSTDNTHFTQIRDWYADLYLDECKVNRIRVGQSKVPYGWESLQSSSNRLALDRSDAINSAVRNERDLGVFYYWTPQTAQDFFKYVLDEGLKGSGNYGVFGIGAYNGQGGSFLEQNDDVHFVSRLTIPYQFDNKQCMEFGVQGYIGEYGVFGSPISPLGVGGPSTPAGTLNATRSIRDERVAASFIWYPQPIGFQAEWNVGRGPALNDAQNRVEDRHLYGGYIQTMAKIDTTCHGTFFPFIRWVTYDGGYKPERNAPFAVVDEWELGTEWQINPQMEFTMSYLLTDRTNTTAVNTAGVRSYGQFAGDVLRFQFQFNY